MVIAEAPRAKSHVLSEGEFADVIGRLKRSEMIASEAQKRGTQTNIIVFGGAAVVHGFGMKRGIGDIDIVIDPMPYSGTYLGTPFCGSFLERSEEEGLRLERQEMFNASMRKDGFEVEVGVSYPKGNILKWALVPSFTDLATGVQINPAGDFLWRFAEGIPSQQLIFARNIGEGDQSVQVGFTGSALTVLTKYRASFGFDPHLRAPDQMQKDFDDIRFIISSVYGSAPEFVAQERMIVARFLNAYGISSDTLESDLEKILRTARRPRAQAKLRKKIVDKNYGDILRR